MRQTLQLDQLADLDLALGAVLAGVDPASASNGTRLAHSTASSIDVTCRIQ
jgi:hypothetical protein